MEKSAAREACLPSFPTIPTPDSQSTYCRSASGIESDESPDRLTDVGCLDHADVVPAISDATDPLLGVLPNEPGNIGFLGRRTSTSHYDGELSCYIDERRFVLVQT